MVVVPASMVGPIATAARRKARRRPPHKRNPDGASQHEKHIKNGVLSVAFGSLAAVVGMGGGVALAKAEMKSKGANIAANVAAGLVAGGALGMVDRTAGTIVAHNYMVAAGQWIMAPIRDDGGSAAPTTLALRRIQGPAVSRAVMENARARAMNTGTGANVGDAEGFGDYERIQGIQADTFGDADDVGGYEALQGIQADTFGDADDVGDADEMGDPFGDVED